MIIVKVQGGLGNQLLQYSIGYVLARRYKKDIAYDFSFYENETKFTKRPYLLDKFNLTARAATQAEIDATRYPFGFISKLQKKILRILNKFLFKKYYVGYDKNFFPLVIKQENAYFEGFWQSYKYYEDDLKSLSEKISLKDTLKVETFKKESLFNEKVSVSVHIRRGDYLNQGTGIQVLSKEYYKKATLLLEESFENPRYFIFSDDINWVKEEMGSLFKDAVYVSAFGLHDYEEFSLMKDCKHAIIANSTFSWFSTLLTNSIEKKVFYPKMWGNVYLDKDTNICPPSWIAV